jgi:hypothetical protein
MRQQWATTWRKPRTRVSTGPLPGQGPGIPSPGSQDPLVVRPDPTREGLGFVSEVRPSCPGSGAFHVAGPDPLRVSGARPFPWPRGDPKATDAA